MDKPCIVNRCKYVVRNNGINGERKRLRGRSRKRWKDRVKELLEEIRFNWKQAYD